jgi:anti-anti-sigma factor
MQKVQARDAVRNAIIRKESVMEIIERTVGDVIVIAMRGDGDAVGYEQVRSVIVARSSDGTKAFVLDLSECTRLDSMGIGEIVRSLFHITRSGGSLKLARVPHRINGLLKITNLATIFECIDDAEFSSSFE